MSWTYETIKNPVYFVLINGKRLPDEIMNFVEEVVYENFATGSDSCSVTIADPLLSLSSNPLFLTQTRFTLQGGYALNNRILLDGYIAAVDFIYPEDNTPQLVIHAMDKSHIMDRKEKKRSWDKKSRYQVVQAIAKEHGFGFIGKANAAANKVEDTISQSNQTDISFLISLADECEMLLYVKGNTLYFQERNYKMKSSATFSYRKPPFDLISFEPRVVQKDLPDEETDDDIDDKGKKQNGKADDSTPKTTPGGKSLTDLQKEVGNSKLIYDGDIKKIDSTGDPRIDRLK